MRATASASNGLPSAAEHRFDRAGRVVHFAHVALSPGIASSPFRSPGASANRALMRLVIRSAIASIFPPPGAISSSISARS